MLEQAGGDAIGKAIDATRSAGDPSLAALLEDHLQAMASLSPCSHAQLMMKDLCLCE